MTIFIVIVLIVVVIFFFTGNTSDASKEYHQENGGLRKSYLKFTNHLEDFYEMDFLNDTGRSFTYSKNVKDTNGNLGQLILGAKLDPRADAKLFSKFKSTYKGEFSGIDITGVDFNDIKSIDDCIKISIDALKTKGVIPYKNKESLITNKEIPVDFFNDWEKTNRSSNGETVSKELEIFINDFFIPDLINPIKFTENYEVLDKPWMTFDEDFGTKNIKKDIIYIPPLFNKFFIAGYPDVYEWVQENGQTDKIKILNQINDLTDEEEKKYFLTTPEKKKEIYRSLINQYKSEIEILETKI